MAIEMWRPKLMRSPFRDLMRMERDMEDLFGRFLPAWGDKERGWAPTVDMVDQKDEIVVKADVPGLEEKDIEVTVQDSTLTIRGERKEEKEEKKENYYFAERSYGAFVRSLPLPAAIEVDRVKATFRKGVLEIHLPKSKEPKGRTVEIKGE
jgi:HSP20 family protein